MSSKRELDEFKIEAQVLGKVHPVALLFTHFHCVSYSKTSTPGIKPLHWPK